MRRNQTGFTLVEIAIVLVIIGLLLGGILKGQELINNARVRNVADGMTQQRAAIQAFFDRYQALPGDYSLGVANIPNVVAGSDGNGDGVIAGNEVIYAWHHLTQAGFLNGCQVCAAPGAIAGGPTAGNSPVNSYGGVEGLSSDALYAVPAGAGAVALAAAALAVNQIHSGNQIPSNVLAEVDRKMDDGNPGSGSIRFSTFFAPGGLGAPTIATCVPAGTWAAAAPTPNCGASLLLN